MSTGRSRYSKIRSNRASELWMSRPTESRLLIGKNRRVWRGVKATTVPMEMSPMMVADAPGEQDEQREQREREDGQAPVEQEHRDHRRDDRGHVRDDRGRRRGHDPLDAADVVRDPRLHLAGARAGEEGEREPLQ